MEMDWTYNQHERQTDGPSKAQSGNPRDEKSQEDDQAEGGRMT